MQINLCPHEVMLKQDNLIVSDDLINFKRRKPNCKMLKYLLFSRKKRELKKIKILVFILEILKGLG